MLVVRSSRGGWKFGPKTALDGNGRSLRAGRFDLESTLASVRRPSHTHTTNSMEDAAWIDGAGTTGGVEVGNPRHLANLTRLRSGSAHDLFYSSSMQVVWAATTAEPQFEPFEDWERVTESITTRQGQNSSQGVSGIELGSRRACCKYPIKKTALPVRCAAIESAKPSGPQCASSIQMQMQMPCSPSEKLV